MTPAEVLRRAAAALHLLANERAAVVRALRAGSPMPALDGFANDRAAAVSALSEALRLGREHELLSLVVYAWLLRFADALASSAEDIAACIEAAEMCERWAGWLDATVDDCRAPRIERGLTP